MSSYRITPVIAFGYSSFKLEKRARAFMFIGPRWKFVGYYLSQRDAEKAIEHIEGGPVHLSTEPRNGVEQ
jgi:hypothetical protein